MGQNNNHKSNFHFLILDCKSFAVNYSLKSGTHRHHQTLGFMSSSLPSQFWNNILWTDETKINLYQSDRKRRVWRRKGTAHDPKHTTSLVKHGGGSVGMYGCQWNWFSCIYWWCDYWQKQQDESEVFRAILSAHIQPNASELIGRRFTVQMDNDPKHTAKQPKSFWRERSGLLCNGQVNHLTWIRLSMHFTCWRQNWRENAPRTSRNWRRLQ